MFPKYAVLGSFAQCAKIVPELGGSCLEVPDVTTMTKPDRGAANCHKLGLAPPLVSILVIQLVIHVLSSSIHQFYPVLSFGSSLQFW